MNWPKVSLQYLRIPVFQLVQGFPGEHNQLMIFVRAFWFPPQPYPPSFPSFPTLSLIFLLLFLPFLPSFLLPFLHIPFHIFSPDIHRPSFLLLYVTIRTSNVVQHFFIWKLFCRWWTDWCGSLLVFRSYLGYLYCVEFETGADVWHKPVIQLSCSTQRQIVRKTK